VLLSASLFASLLSGADPESPAIRLATVMVSCDRTWTVIQGCAGSISASSTVTLLGDASS
jgi:hypothetical protein